MISVPDRSNFNPADAPVSRDNYAPASFPHTPTATLGHIQSGQNLGLTSPIQITMKVLNPSAHKALFWGYGSGQFAVTPLGIYCWSGALTDPPAGTLFDPSFVMQDTRAYRFVVTFGITTTIEVFEEGRTAPLSSLTAGFDTSDFEVYLGYRSDSNYIESGMMLPDGITLLSVTGA